MKAALFLTVVSLIVCLPAPCGADGIGTLVEVSKSMDGAKKELADDTANFERVKSAVESGELRKGETKQSVLSRYGQPVVVNEDFATDRERWVYKPAGSSFFNGARIALLFDSSGALADIIISK